MGAPGEQSPGATRPGTLFSLFVERKLEIGVSEFVIGEQNRAAPEVVVLLTNP